MRHRAPSSIPRHAAALCMLVLLALAPAAQASLGYANTPQAVAKKKRHSKPKIERSASDESAAERDRRLARECRGRPNAGACLGYAY
jgi:hypothetical protein